MGEQYRGLSTQEMQDRAVALAAQIDRSIDMLEALIAEHAQLLIEIGDTDGTEQIQTLE